MFNQSILDARLFGSQEGNDISSLYLDDGYLFFNANPIETATKDNEIDHYPGKLTFQEINTVVEILVFILGTLISTSVNKETLIQGPQYKWTGIYIH